MGAQHTAVAVADKLIRLSREEEIPVTPMQVQKLVYFCHAWHLGLGKGPLIQDAVESWQYGPVIRSVYHELKRYGREPVTKELMDAPDEFDPTEDLIISKVWERYGKIDGITLSKMTHAEGSPWHQTYSNDARTQIIHNHIIRDYYADIINRRGD